MKEIPIFRNLETRDVAGKLQLTDEFASAIAASVNLHGLWGFNCIIEGNDVNGWKLVAGSIEPIPWPHKRKYDGKE